MTESRHPVPSYALYGEGAGPPGSLLHIETIASRSVLHDWEISAHRHPRSVQVLLVLNGQAAITIDHRQEQARGPFYLCIPPGTVHGFGFEPDTGGFVLTLSVDFLTRLEHRGDPLLPLLTEGGRGELPMSTHDRIDWLAQELIAETRRWPVDERLVANLFEALLRSLPTERARAAIDMRLAQFLQLLESHLTEHRPVGFYASRTGMSPRNLARLCSRQLGCSPQQAINRRLSAEAERMLRHTNASVTQAAEALGFQDPSYFSRFIQRETGVRPSALKAGSAPSP